MRHRHRPPPPLAALVDSIWCASRPALAHDRDPSLPTGRADIVIPHLPGAVVSGTHDRVVARGVAGASACCRMQFPSTD